MSGYSESRDKHCKGINIASNIWQTTWSKTINDNYK